MGFPRITFGCGAASLSKNLPKNGIAKAKADDLLFP
jgi:hypothetical protein